MTRRPSDAHLAAVVFAGGVVGVLARAGAEEVLASGGPGWPWATLGVNLIGALLLGWASVTLAERPVRRQLVCTGFCGALTTFSTFQLELYRMVDAGRVGTALLYAAVSLVAGMAAAVGGRRLAR